MSDVPDITFCLDVGGSAPALVGMGTVPTPEEIEAARTPNGGWTRETLASWSVSWPPPKGWRKDLAERSLQIEAGHPAAESDDKSLVAQDETLW